MPNREIRESLHTLARAMTTQVNRDIRPRVNDLESTMASRLKYLVRMNPPIFLGCKMGDDPQPFVDEVYNTVHAMGVTSKKKAEIDSYKLKDIAQVWFTQLRKHS